MNIRRNFDVPMGGANVTKAVYSIILFLALADDKWRNLLQFAIKRAAR